MKNEESSDDCTLVGASRARSISHPFFLHNFLIPPPVFALANSSNPESSLAASLEASLPLATAQETTPVDGELPPTEAPYVDVPADKPALVAVSLQADLTVMMPGDVATITVEVRPLSDESAAGQILTLTLPDQLKPKDPKQALSWTLPDLNQDVLFSQQISLQLKEVGTALKEGVVEMSASVAPTGKWATTTTLLRLGVTKNGNRKPVETTTESTQGDDGTVLIGTQGAVTLLVQPASAQSGTLFRYTELHRWENAAVQTATPQAVAAASAVTMTAEISSTLAVDLQPTELQPLTNQFIPLTIVKSDRKS